MGETDWSLFSDCLDAASVDRGVTAGFTRPNGGSNFGFGFNSLVVATGAVGLFANQSNFAPTPANKGGRVTGCVKRAVSGGPLGFSPFLFVCCQGTSVLDKTYMLGLSDDDPYRIALAKTTCAHGISDDTPGEGGILRRSTATYSPDVWFQLRLDVIVNLNGDVLLKAFQSDLNTHACTSPSWTAIPGLEDPNLTAQMGSGISFVDDALGINSGSAPLTSGRLGFGFSVKDTARRAFFDHIEIVRAS